MTVLRTIPAAAGKVVQTWASKGLQSSIFLSIPKTVKNNHLNVLLRFVFQQAALFLIASGQGD